MVLTPLCCSHIIFFFFSFLLFIRATAYRLLSAGRHLEAKRCFLDSMLLFTGRVGLYGVSADEMPSHEERVKAKPVIDQVLQGGEMRTIPVFGYDDHGKIISTSDEALQQHPSNPKDSHPASDSETLNRSDKNDASEGNHHQPQRYGVDENDSEGLTPWNSGRRHKLKGPKKGSVADFKLHPWRSYNWSDSKVLSLFFSSFAILDALYALISFFFYLLLDFFCFLFFFPACTAGRKGSKDL
jgi:hypothetical protein